MLLGRASYGGRAPEQLPDLADRLAARSGRWVRHAVIDGDAPSTLAVLDEARRAAVPHVLVVPVSIPAERELHLWIRRCLDRWRLLHPGATTDVSILEPLGSHEATVTALADIADDGVAVVRHGQTNAAPNDSSWSSIPVHDHHLLVCRGPRCTLLGASGVARGFAEAAPDGTLTVQTGCLYPCNLGPVAVVHPGDVWYGGLDHEPAVEIVRRHLIGGEPVAGYRVRPDGTRQQRPGRSWDLDLDH